MTSHSKALPKLHIEPITATNNTNAISTTTIISTTNGIHIDDRRSNPNTFNDTSSRSNTNAHADIAMNHHVVSADSPLSPTPDYTYLHENSEVKRTEDIKKPTVTLSQASISFLFSNSKNNTVNKLREFELLEMGGIMTGAMQKGMLEIGNFVSLLDLPIPTILEVFDVNYVEDYGILDYEYVLKNNHRIRVKSLIDKELTVELQELDPGSSQILVYMGKLEENQPDLRIVGDNHHQGLKQRVIAKILRKKSLKQLQAYFDIITFDNIPVNTLLTFTRLSVWKNLKSKQRKRKQDTSPLRITHTVTYRYMMNDGSLMTGKIVVPPENVLKIKNHECGMIHYKSTMTTESGTKKHILTILSVEEALMLLSTSSEKEGIAFRLSLFDDAELMKSYDDDVAADDAADDDDDDDDDDNIDAYTDEEDDNMTDDDSENKKFEEKDEVVDNDSEKSNEDDDNHISSEASRISISEI